MILSLLLSCLPLTFTNVTAIQQVDNNDAEDMTASIIVIDNASTFPAHPTPKPSALGPYVTYEIEGYSFEESINFSYCFNNDIDEPIYLKYGFYMSVFGRGNANERYISFNCIPLYDNADSVLSNIYLDNVNLSVRYSNNTSAYFTLPNIYFNGSDNFCNTLIYYNSLQTISYFVIDYDIKVMPLEYLNGLQGGITDAYERGYEAGSSDMNGVAYQTGFSDGVQYSEAGNSTALTIFTGIINVALLPVNFFLQVLNFEVFGINIGALVTSLMTVAIIIIIIRLVTGKKND